MTQRITIKNMVCPRCIEAVAQILEDLSIAHRAVHLGSVELDDALSALQKEQLRKRLQEGGFELLDDKQAQLISEIKSILVQEIHYQKEQTPFNISTLLKEKLHYDYPYLSRLFSMVEGKTIERFVMAQKIEKVKELLTYDEHNLSEIAFQLHYSSTAHLSAQFKKITGMTPSAFRKLHRDKRHFLDQL